MPPAGNSLCRNTRPGDLCLTPVARRERGGSPQEGRLRDCSPKAPLTCGSYIYTRSKDKPPEEAEKGRGDPGGWKHSTVAVGLAPAVSFRDFTLVSSSLASQHVAGVHCHVSFSRLRELCRRREGGLRLAFSFSGSASYWGHGCI